jgi:small subunit ribosomal protein S13
MVYFLNTNISDKKRILIALQNIFGVGKQQSALVSKYIGISLRTPIQDLTVEIRNQIVIYIENNLRIGNDLKQALIQIKERQMALKSYKGQRLKFKLPQRGQRTHTNGKTAKKLK